MLLGVSRGLLNRPHHQGGLQVAFRGPSMLAGLEADDTCIRLSVLWVLPGTQPVIAS